MGIARCTVEAVSEFSTSEALEASLWSLVYQKVKMQVFSSLSFYALLH